MKIKSLILGGVFIDAYNHSVNIDIAGTITTRVDASNMNFVTDIMEYKGKEIQPNESFYWNTTQKFFRGQLGGGVSRTVKTDDGLAIMEEPKVEQIGNLYPDKDGFKNRTSGRVYSSDGLSPTLRTVTGGHNEPKIVEPNIIKEGNYHKSGHNASSIVNAEGISPTVMENHGTVTATIEQPSLRIRKLTPRECFRLMDCDDEVIDKIQGAGISNSQQYKMAGNSIVVNVLYNLFRKLFTETENEENQLTLFLTTNYGNKRQSTLLL
jgi:site-specific DNA-cytosine methylase